MALYLLYLLALLMPGADVLMVLKTSIKYNKSSGIQVALGISSALFLYSTLAFSLIEQLQGYQELIKWISVAGAFYLLYLSVLCFKDSREQNKSFSLDDKNKRNKNNFFLLGFLTNLSNPKILIFFSSIVPLLAEDSYFLMISLLISVTSLVYFSLVSLIFSKKKIQRFYFSKIYIIEFIFGIVLFFIAGYIIQTNLF